MDFLLNLANSGRFWDPSVPPIRGAIVVSADAWAQSEWADPRPTKTPSGWMGAATEYHRGGGITQTMYQ